MFNACAILISLIYNECFEGPITLNLQMQFHVVFISCGRPARV
jgi:hypothetical protein